MTDNKWLLLLVYTFAVCLVFSSLVKYFQKDTQGANSLYADSLTYLRQDLATVKASLVSEQNLRGIAQDRLGLTNDSLTGVVRAYSELSLRMRSLRDSIKHTGVSYVDTLNGFTRVALNRYEVQRDGYKLGLRPSVFLPSHKKFNYDSISVINELDIAIDPVNIAVALTEDSAHDWRTFVSCKHPLFQDFVSVDTKVSPYKQSWKDKTRLGLGLLYYKGTLVYGSVVYDKISVYIMLGDNIGGGVGYSKNLTEK